MFDMEQKKPFTVAWDSVEATLCKSLAGKTKEEKKAYFSRTDGPVSLKVLRGLKKIYESKRVGDDKIKTVRGHERYAEDALKMFSVEDVERLWSSIETWYVPNSYDEGCETWVGIIYRVTSGRSAVAEPAMLFGEVMEPAVTPLPEVDSSPLVVETSPAAVMPAPVAAPSAVSVETSSPTVTPTPLPVAEPSPVLAVAAAAAPSTPFPEVETPCPTLDTPADDYFAEVARIRAEYGIKVSGYVTVDLGKEYQFIRVHGVYMVLNTLYAAFRGRTDTTYAALSNAEQGLPAKGKKRLLQMLLRKVKRSDSPSVAIRLYPVTITENQVVTADFATLHTRHHVPADITEVFLVTRGRQYVLAF
jgi:hypothetical protein